MASVGTTQPAVGAPAGRPEHVAGEPKPAPWFRVTMHDVAVAPACAATSCSPWFLGGGLVFISGLGGHRRSQFPTFRFV
ncbi:MAG: hypothetical protein QOE58_3062 [Actinomycetota bacterium]|jgi:hypothetical protein|nr:hypothetical protein [Actinomycetota bacterium]